MVQSARPDKVKRGKRKVVAQVIAEVPEKIPTQEELEADAKLWTDTFNAMTPEQFANLDAFFEENAAEGSIPIEQMFEEEDAAEALTLKKPGA